MIWCNNIDENELEFVRNFPEFLTGREISRSFKIWEFPTEAIQLNDLMCLSNENKDKIKLCGIVFRLVVEWNLATFFDGEGSCSRLSSWAWLRGGLATISAHLPICIKKWKLGRVRLSCFIVRMALSVFITTCLCEALRLDTSTGSSPSPITWAFYLLHRSRYFIFLRLGGFS